MTRYLLPVVGLFLLAAMAGCDDATEGEGFPPGQTGSQPTGGPDAALKVQDPLDATPFLADPCKLVDNQIVSQLGPFDPGKTDVNSEMAKKLTGPGCEWSAGSNFGLNIDLRINTVHQEFAAAGSKGIAGIYGGKESGLVDYLEPVVIEGHPGYPAADAGQDGDREKGDCTLYVGISDELTFKSSVLNEDDPSQACPAAHRIAAAVLDSLKKGS